MKIFFIFCLLIASQYLFSQDQREDSTRLYQTPEEVITTEDWNRFLDLRQNQGINPKSKIQEIEKLLDKYYSQFVGEKRILDAKINGKRFSPEISKNTLRLLIKEMKSQRSQTFLIRDSNILFEIYGTLGELYNSDKNNPKAIQSYYNALRYRDFTNSEKRLITEYKEKSTGDERTQTHIRIKENYENAKKELEETKANYYREKARDIRTPTIKVLPPPPDFSALEEKVKKAKEDYEKSLQTNIQPQLDKKGETDSNAVYQLAQVVKIAEDENQDRLKILDKSNTFWGQPFILFDTKKNTNLFAYEQLLEFAYKLYPKNPKVTRELAESLRTSQKTRNSLDFYLKYIELVQENPPNEEVEKTKLTESFLKIGILYSNLKRYVQAAEYYEKYVKTQEESEDKTKFYFHLGDFYSKQLGNYPKSAEYFGKWLDSSSKIDAENLNPVQEARKKAMEFRANFGISLHYKFLRLPQEETKSLETCYNLYKEIQSILEKENQNYQDSLKQINEIKKDLINSTNKEDLTRLEEAKRNSHEAKANVKSIQTKYKALSKNLVLFKLAEFAEDNRDFERAKQFYKEIVEVGNELDINRALKSITRIDKTLQDGIIRDRF